MAVLRVILVLCALLPAGGAFAQACVSPGAIIDVPTRGFLRTLTPNLFYDNGSGLRPIEVVSFTSSRLVLRAPRTGLVSRERFQVFHVDNAGARNVANLRTCDIIVDPTVPRPPAPTARARARAPLPPTVRATANDVVAPSGGPEYAIVGSSSDISRAEGVVIGAGGSILRRTNLGAVGQGILFVDLNGQLTLPDLSSELASRGIDATADRHTVYSGAQGAQDYAPRLVGFADISRCRLSAPVRIGIIDGPVDTRISALARTAIETRSALSPGDRPGSADHGTAIATLIAGSGDQLRGIAPGAQLFAVTAFARSGARDVAKLESIASGIDWLLERKVDLVNLSLEGPVNRALARVIGIAADRGMVMVAAAGNAGQRAVAYPASDPDVIAVTAVDAAKRRYRRANTGRELDFAAPGVDILVPRRRGTAFESGTSFASAIATGMIAYEFASGRRSTSGIRQSLSARAEDLGPRGRDSEFGFGLIRADGGC